MYLIVTNNPMAAKEFAGQGEVRLYPEDTYREILVRARDLVYIGHRLCNHPLYGSLRPHETPYRTVVPVYDTHHRAHATDYDLV